MKSFLKWVVNKYHNNQWEVIEKHPLTKNYYDSWTNERIFTDIGARYILQCKVFG